MPFALPELPYPFDALEPHIDARTMEVHYSKHHQGYTDKLNAAVDEYPELADMPAEALLMDLENVPESVRDSVRNNGGGYVNHALFWASMAPGAGGEPTGEIGAQILNTFGSFTAFQEKFNDAATSRFGSGWAWLVVQPDGTLAIGSTANQDNPLMGDKIAGMSGLPLLGLDVWEHAYYLKYMNKRPDYIAAWWHVVNWDQVESRLAEVQI